MRKLGIHHMTAVDLDPVAFIDLAADAGFDEVSLFVNAMGPRNRFPTVDRDNIERVRGRLGDRGLRIANVESFTVAPGARVGDARPHFELAAELGARGFGIHLFDTEPDRVIDTLGCLCAEVKPFSLRLCIEMMALSPAWNTLGAVAALVQQVGQPGPGIGIDLLHLVRSGGTPADVAGVEPGLLAYAQLCDGADLTVTGDYAAEAVAGRLAPGEGVFPVTEFLRSLPVDLPLELEVPQSGTGPTGERLVHLMAATRALVAQVEGEG